MPSVRVAFSYAGYPGVVGSLQTLLDIVMQAASGNLTLDRWIGTECSPAGRTSGCVQGRKDTYGHQCVYASSRRYIRIIAILYDDRSIVTRVRVYKASHGTALLCALDLKNPTGVTRAIGEYDVRSPSNRGKCHHTE